MDQSDRRRFDGAISKLLYSTTGTARVSATIIGAYWSVLKAYTWEVVAAAMTRALNDSTGHVTPATLSEYCRQPSDQDRAAADKVREERLRTALVAADDRANVEGEKRFGSIWRDTEFQAMKDAANMEYGRRCNGRPSAGFRFPTVDVKGYDGKFDCMAVVNAAPRPKGKSPNRHAKAWEDFWRALREEFELYVKNQGVTGKPPEAL